MDTMDTMDKTDSLCSSDTPIAKKSEYTLNYIVSNKYKQIEYPFYIINSNVYLFGSIHDHNPNTIHSEIAKLMTTCDDLFVEYDSSLFDNYNNENLIMISSEPNLQIRLMMLYDANNVKCKLKKANIYTPSAGFMYEKSLLDNLSNTTFFKNNLGNCDIKDIPFYEITENQIYLTLWFGIDAYFVNLYKLNNKKCYGLDEKKHSLFVNTFLSLIFITGYFAAFVCRLCFGKLTSDLNLDINEPMSRKKMSAIKSNKILYDHLIIKRNAKWIPKIKKIIDNNNGTKHKSLIIVGAGHIDDLIDKLSGYDINEFNYFNNKIEPFNKPLCDMVNLEHINCTHHEL